MLGAFLLLRRSMLDALDGFDDKYRLYCEDIDLCYRAASRPRNAGTCRTRSSSTRRLP